MLSQVAFWPACGCRRSTFRVEKLKKQVLRAGKSTQKFSKIDLRQPQVEKTGKLEMTREKIEGNVEKDWKEYSVQVDLRLPQK